MADPTGEADRDALRLDFDRRLMLQIRGSAITSDSGFLAYRDLDDALGLTDTGADALADARTGKNWASVATAAAKSIAAAQTGNVSYCGSVATPRTAGIGALPPKARRLGCG
jgi:hypothetical protein